jgi:hypothetical protein
MAIILTSNACPVAGMFLKCETCPEGFADPWADQERLCLCILAAYITPEPDTLADAKAAAYGLTAPEFGTAEWFASVPEEPFGA